MLFLFSDAFDHFFERFFRLVGNDALNRIAAVAGKPRQDMDVKMGHHLTAYLAVVHADRRPVGPERGEHPARNRLHGPEKGGDIIVGQIKQCFAVMLRNDDGMARSAGMDIEKRHRFVVLGDRQGGNLAPDYLTE